MERTCISGANGNFCYMQSVYSDRLHGIRGIAFILGGAAVVGVASALLLVSHSRVRGGDAKRQPASAVTVPRPDSLLAAPRRDPTQFPPEHVDACDFRAYRPTRISDWLPRAVPSSVRPEYPAQARRNRIAGTVNMFVLINRKGRVERVCSVGPKDLRMAAETAAAEWQFRRTTINAGIDSFGYIQETLVFKFVLEN